MKKINSAQAKTCTPSETAGCPWVTMLLSRYIAQKAALETMSPELGKKKTHCVSHTPHKMTELKVYNKYQLEVKN